MIFILRRHGPWVSGALLGLSLLAAGIFGLVEGLNTRAEVRDQLVDEQIVTGLGADIPGVPVTDAKTARSQAELIKEHTLGTWGPYSEQAPDDPQRTAFIDGVALRTALNLAVVGFGVTDLVVGMAIILVFAGAATVVLAAPALYLLAGMVMQRQGAA